MYFEPYNNKKLLHLEEVKNSIFDDFKNHKMHHSLLIVGDKGLGKATLCYHLANQILDFETSLKEDKPISLFGEEEKVEGLDDKNPTFNLIKNKKHPDLLVIEREFDSKTSKFSKEIKVSSARKITEFITLTPFLSKNKVIIIDSIDEMNISAQNAILKAIEEPLKNTYILLVCNNINNILETIKSRCGEVAIKKYTFSEYLDILNYTSQDKIKLFEEKQLQTLYKLSNSSISFSIDILEEDGLFIYNKLEYILSQNELNIDEIQIFCDKLSNNEKLFNLFKTFTLFYLHSAIEDYVSSNQNSSTSNNNNFLLKNTEKSLLEKFNFAEKLFFKINTYNLNKKHALLVLFNSLFK